MSSAFWLTVGRDALASAIGLTLARFAAWRPLRDWRARQRRIADLLDTNTPGGLADVVAAVHQHNKRHHDEGSEDDDGSGDGPDSRHDPRPRPDARRAEAGRPASSGNVGRSGRG